MKIRPIVTASATLVLNLTGIEGLNISAEDVTATGDNNSLDFSTAAFNADLGDAVSASGDALSFSLQKGEPINVSGSSIAAFVGYSGRGLSVSQADFNLNLNTDNTYDYQIENANAGLVGVDGLTLGVEDVNVIGDENIASVATGNFALGIDDVGYIKGTGLALYPAAEDAPLRIAATGVNAFVGAGGGTDDEAGGQVKQR